MIWWPEPLGTQPRAWVRGYSRARYVRRCTGLADDTPSIAPILQAVLGAFAGLVLERIVSRFIGGDR